MLKRGIQGASSTNCIALVCMLKPVYSGRLTARPSTAPICAIWRTSAAWRSLNASTATPNAIGIQMVRLSQGAEAITRPLNVPEPQRQQHEYADDHGEGVLVDVAGLEQAHHAADPADYARRAVDHKAVDDGHIAEFPQPVADRARAAGEKPLIEAVATVFLHQDVDDEAELLPQHAGQRRIDDVQIPGRPRPGAREPERQAGEPLQHHGENAVVLARHFREALVFRGNIDGRAEIAAVKHRAYGP